MNTCQKPDAQLGGRGWWSETKQPRTGTGPTNPVAHSYVVLAMSSSVKPSSKVADPVPAQEEVESDEYDSGEDSEEVDDNEEEGGDEEEEEYGTALLIAEPNQSGDADDDDDDDAWVPPGAEPEQDSEEDDEEDEPQPTPTTEPDQDKDKKKRPRESDASQTDGKKART
ncbi:hypothetical protein OPQ81_002930 [Rhizoctonia solani]|nr:hypothetical protein OPQ81_002930 [Rhizoctonia solani]